jgi:2-deoxy-D-gluconate 3-dehydrogenase
MTHDLFDITGKKAIVTGGTRGLGRGMAEGLLEAGCEVAIIGSSDGVFATAEEFRAKGWKCHGVRADLRKRDEVYRSFDEALGALGGDLDILVTAAGIQRRHSAENFPVEEWDEVINVNLNAVFIQCQLAGRIMLKKGCGKIINIASMASFFGGADRSRLLRGKGRRRAADEGTDERLGRTGNQRQRHCTRLHGTEMNAALVADERETGRLRSASRRTGGERGMT